MSDEGMDPCHKAFAEYLGCECSIVDDAYDASGVGLVPDQEEAKEAADAIEIYEQALKEFERFCKTMSRLSDVERASFQIQDSHWSDSIPPIKEGLEINLRNTRNRKNRVSGKGPSNHRANAIAEFVACVFDRLDWPVTFGCRAADDEPSTRFGRAVKECFTIYDVRLPPKISEYPRKLENQSAMMFHMTETGKLANWKRPAQAAYRRRNQHNA
jgi:hypothetical protein